MNYWPLLGVPTVVAGFVLKRNPALVVVVAGVVSGFAAHIGVGDLLALLGSSFIGNRALLLLVLTLPVIGLLEHMGLRERADIIAVHRVAGRRMNLRLLLALDHADDFDTHMLIPGGWLCGNGKRTQPSAACWSGRSVLPGSCET